MPSTAHAGGLLAGRFQTGRTLGRDTVGTYRQAEDELTGRSVVLHEFAPELGVTHRDVDVLRTIIAEMPNLPSAAAVAPREVVAVGKSFLTVSQPFDGWTLAEARFADPDGALPVGQLRPIATDMARAMEAAHRLRVVHGGLRPGNVFLDESGRVYLVDFGIGGWITSVALRSKRKRVLEDVTPYVSRSLLAGKGPYMTDDVFAFGAIFYEATSGKIPYPLERRGLFSPKKPPRVPKVLGERRVSAAAARHGLIPPSWEQAILACVNRDGFARPQGFGTVARLIANERQSGGMREEPTTVPPSPRDDPAPETERSVSSERPVEEPEAISPAPSALQRTETHEVPETEEEAKFEDLEPVERAPSPETSESTQPPAKAPQGMDVIMRQLWDEDVSWATSASASASQGPVPIAEERPSGKGRLGTYLLRIVIGLVACGIIALVASLIGMEMRRHRLQRELIAAIDSTPIQATNEEIDAFEARLLVARDELNPNDWEEIRQLWLAHLREVAKQRSDDADAATDAHGKPEVLSPEQ